MTSLSLKSFRNLPLCSRPSSNSLTGPAKLSFLPPSASLVPASQGGPGAQKQYGMICIFPNIPYSSTILCPMCPVLLRIYVFNWKYSFTFIVPWLSHHILYRAQFDIFRVQKPHLIGSPAVCITKPFPCSWELIFVRLSFPLEF